MKWPWADSITEKIFWGYYVLVGIVVVGVVLTWINLSGVRSHVYSLEATSELLDTVLEVRRYEKNWLLYRKGADFFENERMIGHGFELLLARREKLAATNLEEEIRRLNGELTKYRSLMQREFEIFNAGGEHKLVEEIRATGKELVEIADTINEEERRAIAKTLDLVTVSGVIFVWVVIVLAVYLGKQMASTVVSPLQQIVRCTRRIAQGDFASCRNFANVVEIQAVVEALNAMLSELERREKQMIRTEKLAAVGTLVAGVTHELNNPLSNAGASAQILLEEIQESDSVPRQFQIEMLEQVVEQTDRARVIVRSLLEFSREREVKIAEISLATLLHKTVDLIRGQIPARVDLDLEVKEDVSFFGDKQKLQQALVNLLLNAFQAVGEEGNIGLRGEFRAAEKQVVIEVADSGPGIPPDVMDRIFDPFFTTKDVGEGSGLGLAITREIIAKHGGVITARSGPGEGATFTISVPVNAPTADQA